MDPSMPLDIICDLFYAKSSPVSLRRRGQAELSYHRSYIKKKQLVMFWIKKCFLDIFTGKVTNIIGKVTFIHRWVAILNSVCTQSFTSVYCDVFSFKNEPCQKEKFANLFLSNNMWFLCKNYL